jgi:hypothetical protein
MQMMQTFHIRWKATAVFLAYLDLLRAQSSPFSFV